MNEKQFITQFIDEERHTMNPQLFVRNDMEIVDQLKNIILSCQKSNPYFTIKVESFEVINDYADIINTLEKYYDDIGKKKKNSKTKRKENIYSYIDINHTAMRLLKVGYYITAEGGKDEDNNMRITVLIGVPRVVDKYYCEINGIKRSILYQIVDGSTYNNGTSSQKSPTITMKTIFMAVRVYKYYMDLKTVEGATLKSVNYVSRIFNKRVQAPKYIFAKYGFYGAMAFFGVNGIYISDTPISDNSYYCFKKHDKCFLYCPKILFDKDYVVQTICSTIYNSIVPGIQIKRLFERDYWLRSLGADFNTGAALTKIIQSAESNKSTVQDTLPKGYSVLDSFESIYDLNGKNAIKLPEEDKKDMYCVLRWLLREFNELRLKDNLDISIKRIRFAEYMASMYAMKVAKGIYRVADMNKRASCSSLVKALRTDPMYLLTAISRCRMVEYRNMTSDMDALTALKFTFKGVSGLGETNSQTIPLIYRYIHPSHVGRVDLDASSDGDPGMKGIISPFTQIHEGGYFENTPEPNGWEDAYRQLLDEWERVNNLIEPMEFQSRILGIDKSENTAIANEVSYMAKSIIKPYINDALYMSEPVAMEDLDDDQILRIFEGRV